MAQHGLEEHSHGEWHKPVQTRSERFSSFLVDDFADPTGREVDFKYTPIDRMQPLLGTLDGSRYAYQLSGGDGVTVSWLPRDSARVGISQRAPEDKVSANAWSDFDEALSIEVPAEFASDDPISLVRNAFGDMPRAAHTVITVGAHARALIVLDNMGLARLAENIEIVTEDDSQLTIVSVQDWDRTAINAATHFIRVGRNARVNHIAITLGGDFVRVIPQAAFAGPGAEVALNGLYFADAGQHLEQQLYVDHNQPNCTSRVTYKGALQGEHAHTVWIGDVLIRADAYGTDTYEMNRNLLLTDGARADSVPNLEIETGEIVGAGHASATGRFDDEHLFYLQARGISEAEARRLVVRGFLMEIVQQIGNAPLQERFAAALEAELANTSV